MIYPNPMIRIHISVLVFLFILSLSLLVLSPVRGQLTIQEISERCQLLYIPNGTAGKDDCSLHTTGTVVNGVYDTGSYVVPPASERFTGGNSQIEFDNNKMDGDGNVTIAMGVNLSDSATNEWLYSRIKVEDSWDSFYFAGSVDEMRVYLSRGGGQTNPGVDATPLIDTTEFTWITVTFTPNSTTLMTAIMYYNGTEVMRNTANIGSNPITNPVSLCKHDWDDIFCGATPDIRINCLLFLNYTAPQEDVQTMTDAYYDGFCLGSAPAEDTCTAPGSGDWNIDCSDNCVLDSPQDVPGDMHLNGIGTIILSSPLTFTGSNQLFSVASGCTLDIRSGGEIG